MLFTRIVVVSVKTYTMPIPPPKQVTNPYGNRKTFGSHFETDIRLDIGKRHIRESVITLPVSFQKECRRIIQNHIVDVQSWFTSSPSRETLERLITTPAEFPLSGEILKRIQFTPKSPTFLLKMSGILLEDTRILPDLEIIEKKEIEEVTDIPIDLDEPIKLKSQIADTFEDDLDGDGDDLDENWDDRESDGDDEEDDEDGRSDGDDEDGDEEEGARGNGAPRRLGSSDGDSHLGSPDDASSTGTVSRALERIQNRLDRVREDLEDLRRLKSKRGRF